MEQFEEDKDMSYFGEMKTANFDNEFSVYQHRAAETAVYPREIALTYLSLGLFGECGEVANRIKKIMRGDYQGKGLEAHNRAVDGIMDECGDVMWYTSQLLLVVNVDMGTLNAHETFEDYHTSLKKLASSYKSPDEVVFNLGRSVGFLCDTVSLDLNANSIDAINAIGMSVVQSVCILTHIYDRPFTSIFTLNLDKLKVRHAEYKQQHTM
jgi:NTP pyrophosphatase (non-canonical NTP hydrolase)